MGAPSLRVGDLVAVQYPWEGDHPDPPNSVDPEVWVGLIIEIVDPLNPYAMDKMWCFKTESVHILNSHRDQIEVLNK